jgi:hypothetical protein
MKGRNGTVVQLVECKDLPPALSRLELVLDGASQPAGVAAGAAVEIENESLLHQDTFTTSTKFS